MQEIRDMERMADMSANYRARNPDAWMGTYTGKKLFILDMQPEDINLVDIAHALSLKCRFQGHCVRFNSVAEHSVLASRMIQNPDKRREALMHDAAEAYLPDVPSPCKPLLVGFKNIEHVVEEAIWHRFDLAYAPNDPDIKEVDRRMVMTEREQNMKNQPVWDTHIGIVPYPSLRLPLWSPQAAEQHFLDRARELGIK